MLTEFRHVLNTLGNPVDLFFYGAGCGSNDIQEHLQAMLSAVFLNARCHCEGDLLGACRALCGNQPGMVGILGTGSNLCYYDGQTISLQKVSSGYILGDEGSGNHIGKRLLKDYLEERMPQYLRTMFYDEYRMTAPQLIDRLYSQPRPNRFLASFVPFADRHQDDPYIIAVLEYCFSSFFSQLDFFPGQRALPLNLVGGLAHSFQKQLQRVAVLNGVNLGFLLPNPMPGLIEFHSK